MLVSHLRNFIFLKSIKTAGTTVEIFFEEFCRPNAQIYLEGEEWTRSVESVEGIIGTRGKFAENEKYYNHKTAEELRSELGNEVWSDYFKFSIVRNPYDELISRFWFFLDSKARISLLGADLGATQKEFKKWVMTQENLNSRIYLIDGKLEIDFMIRYEFLEEDVGRVCTLLGVEKNVSELQKFKSGIRPREGIWSLNSDYFDSDSIAYVESHFAWELKRFNYTLN